MMRKVLLVAVVLLVASATALRNDRITRRIDLTSSLARHSLTIEYTNVGSTTATAYVLPLEKTLAGKLALFVAEDSQGKELKVTPGAVQQKNNLEYQEFSIAINAAAGAVGKMEVKLVFAHALQPFPTKVTQQERVLVVYEDNHYVLSSYETVSQKTDVVLGSPVVESRSEKSPTSFKGDTITYGSYSDVRALAVSPMRVHFQTAAPFLTVVDLVREIEVSHWGSNVAFEEHYHILNEGPELSGPFSRLDYQRMRGVTPSAIAEFTQVLPVGARDVYYRDDIGNISTSHFRDSGNEAVLELAPRFTMFGGWKSLYYMGYNMDMGRVVRVDAQDSTHFILEATLAPSFKTPVSFDRTSLRIILPEGASDIEVHSPYPVDETREYRLTYLDSGKGRPVVVLSPRGRLTSDHVRTFHVTYRLTTSAMMQEPMLLIGSFMVLFALAMVCVRLDFSLSASGRSSAVSNRVEELVAKFLDVMSNVQQHHEKKDQALKALFAGSKKEAQFEQENQKTSFDLDACYKQLAKITEELAGLDPSLNNAVKDVEMKEKSRAKVHSDALLAQVRLHNNPRNGKQDVDKLLEQYENLCLAIDELVEDIRDY